MPSTPKTKVHTEKHPFPKEAQEEASTRIKKAGAAPPDPRGAAHFDCSSEINFHLLCPSCRSSTPRRWQEGCKYMVREWVSRPITSDVFDYSDNVHALFCVYQHFKTENKQTNSTIKEVGGSLPHPLQQRNRSVAFPRLRGCRSCAQCVRHLVSHPSESPPVALLRRETRNQGSCLAIPSTALLPTSPQGPTRSTVKCFNLRV